MDRQILLGLDVEEFDIPLEYGHAIAPEEQIAVGAAGLDWCLDLLDRLEVTATMFVTARFALAEPDRVRRAATRHEIASHGFAHDRFEPEDLVRSREILADLTGQPVLGFRRARMERTDPAPLLAAGYRYDSSDNPVWLPGRYNNFFTPRTAHLGGELLHVPASATPLLRVPLFWLAVKNLPFWWTRLATARTLAHDGYVNLYFHPWEFEDLRSYGLPRIVRRLDGEAMRARLEAYLRWLRPRGRFVTFAEFDRGFRASAAAPARPLENAGSR